VVSKPCQQLKFNICQWDVVCTNQRGWVFHYVWKHVCKGLQKWMAFCLNNSIIIIRKGKVFISLDHIISLIHLLSQQAGILYFDSCVFGRAVRAGEVSDCLYMLAALWSGSCWHKLRPHTLMSCHLLLLCWRTTTLNKSWTISSS